MMEGVKKQTKKKLLLYESIHSLAVFELMCDLYLYNIL